jgi:cytoskeletal protein RodZ
MTPYPQESAPPTPGAILKRCREFHDISLEEACETTKIGVSHLKALEEDRIGEFANLVYLKGFLRIYATYLGLNADDMSRMYDKLYGSAAGGDSADPSLLSETRRTGKRLAFLKKLVFPALLLLTILITATFFKTSPPAGVRSSFPPVATSAISSSTPPSAAIQTPKSSAQTKQNTPLPDTITRETGRVTSPVSEQQPTRKTSETGVGFVLKIKVIQNGTLTAAVDGSAGQNYELTSGDVIEWKAEKSVTLELSDAGSVEVELNGKPYKSLGPTGKPVYVELAADGLKP